MANRKSNATLSQLRIIGGTWRSRKLTFPALPGVRPTPERVRETLFNWLQPYIAGAVTLDLFAGSGALSFEALSRGARHAYCVDASRAVVKALSANASILDANEMFTASCANAMAYLRGMEARADVVFVDPPFAETDWPEKVVQALSEFDCVTPRALVYLEQHAKTPAASAFAKMELLKSKVASDVRYQLWQYRE